MRAAEQIEFYRSCLVTSPLMRDLDQASLDALARVARIVGYADGESIHARDDVMTYSGVILSGGIRSSLTSQDGYEFSISILRRGAYYGTLGLLEPTPAVWDCSAYGTTELVVIQNRDYRSLMNVHPGLAIMLARATNYRLRKAYIKMSNIVLESLERRIRRMLIMLIEPDDGSGRTTIPEIAITQEMLGHFVQGSRPSVNKALRELERLGIVEIGYGLIRILDEPALRSGFEGETFLVL